MQMDSVEETEPIDRTERRISMQVSHGANCNYIQTGVKISREILCSTFRLNGKMQNQLADRKSNNVLFIRQFET